MPSASGRRNRSASAVVAEKEHGRHELRVAVSSLAVLTPPGAEGVIKSCPFTVGGHRWIIYYFPNGIDADTAGHVSVFLLLDEDVAKPVTAEFRLSALVQRKSMGFINRKQEIVSKPKKLHYFFGQDSFGLRKFAKRGGLADKTDGCKDGAFTIRCDISVVFGLRVEAAAPRDRIPPSDLHKNLGDLLQSGRGADVVFEVGGERFAAHRCVLGARSPVISAELLGAAATGGDAGVVRVDGVEPRAFKALLRYAYTDALPEMEKEEEEAMLRNLLVAADKYGLERLKLICEDRLCQSIDVGTVVTKLALAEQHHCHALKEACLDFLSKPANRRAVMAASVQ